MYSGEHKEEERVPFCLIYVKTQENNKYSTS